MKIDWGRVLNAGLIAEILLIVVFQIIVALYSNSNAANLTMILGSFIFMLVGALWVGQKIESRFILHGFLVGIVAVVYYVIRTLPDVLSGEYANYWVIALWGHTPKLLGGIVGGYIAGRRKTKAV
jgi:hypothetical protein